MGEEMREHFGVEFEPQALPDAELLSIDTLTLTTHTGTHIDAPAHYGSTASYGTGVPRTIDQMPLDWFYGPGVVLDLTSADTSTVDARGIDRLCGERSPTRAAGHRAAQHGGVALGWDAGILHQFHRPGQVSRPSPA